jgi:hypothetical protein
MKALFNRLFRPKPMQIVISFYKHADGRITSDAKLSPELPAAFAIEILNRVKGNITNGLARKCWGAGLKRDGPRRRVFIGKQKIKDIS